MLTTLADYFKLSSIGFFLSNHQSEDFSMSTKTTQKEFTVPELQEELKEIKSWKSKEPKNSRVIEIARHFAAVRQWDMAMEALQLISNEKERNLLIADLVEGFLLPAHEIALAKKFAKYLTPINEIESFIWIKIALADNDTEQAMKIAGHLPSPISRNFAFIHIMESYFANKVKNKENELRQLMIENIRTIYDNKIRSYILRDLALNLFLPNNEKGPAIEMANLIPDELIQLQVLDKINASK